MFDPFIANAPFLYLLKTSENGKVFWCFQVAEKGCIGDGWVELSFIKDEFPSDRRKDNAVPFYKKNNKQTLIH